MGLPFKIYMKIKNFILNNSIGYYFYKKIKILRNSIKGKHLGEYGEDIFIRRFFKDFKKGFYVDIGSYHPIKGSLTYYLFKKGWRGLNVDLSKISIDLFDIERPKDFNLNVAVSDFNGDTFYYENGPINQQNSLTENKKKKKIKIKSFTLNSLLGSLKIENFDYLNIDVEGNDFKVISSFNFLKYKPKMISIEQNIHNLDEIMISECHKLLSSNGYFLTAKIGVTCIYLEKRSENNIEEILSI
jgi:hypothetical protein